MTPATRRSPLLIIFVTIFIDLAGFGMILPVLPFFALQYDASAFQVGLLAAVYSGMQFVFAPVWGRLSDRFGRRPVLLTSLSGSAVSLLLFGLATSLPALFAARCAAGIFTANIATAQAYIADSTAPEDRARGMGLVGAAFGLGFIFGPAIGGLLTPYGLEIPAFAAAALAGCNTIAAWFFLPESRPGSRTRSGAVSPLGDIRQLLKHPAVGLLVALFFLITLAFANLEATFALMTAANFGYDARDNAWLFTYIGAIAATVNGVLIGPLVRMFGEGRLLTTGLVLQAGAFFFLPYTLSLPGLLMAVGLIAVGNGLSQPTLPSLISRHTDTNVQGQTLGVMQSMGSLARVFGPAWGGWFFGALGVGAPYVSGGILLFLCAGLSLYALARLTTSKSASP